MLKLRNLRKQFGSIPAVDGVSFDVNRGEIFGLLGPNGAGKTTCIRMVLNILEPDSGEVTYDDRHFSDHIRNVIGYLPEERGLYKRNKVWEMMMYFAALRGMESGTAKAAAYRWLKRFGLLDWKDRRVDELSKGNQQKLQFISAIIHKPDLVILDEPFSGLDPVNQVLFKDVFLELKEQGVAVIFSTHQMDQAERLSDSLCLIDHGKVVLRGTVREVKQRHGKNAIHVEFDGNGASLKLLSGIRNLMLYGNAAEFELLNGETTGSILTQLISHVQVKKFEVVEPSLHTIFMNAVSHGSTGASR